MTKREINEYITFRRDLARAVSIRDALRCVAEPGAQNLTGLPHAPGCSDRIGGLAAEIADMTTEIEKLQDCVQEREGAMIAFIQGIQDNQTRIIFRLRIMHLLSWRRIAESIGGGNTASGVCSVYYRYIKKFCA